MAEIILGVILKKKRMTKIEFARRLKVQYPAVFPYFREAYNPSFRMMERWAKALGVRIKDLIRE